MPTPLTVKNPTYGSAIPMKGSSGVPAPQAVQGNRGNADANKPAAPKKPKAYEDAMVLMRQQALKNMNKQAPTYKPQQVTPQKVQAVASAGAQGMPEMRSAVDAAAANAQIAGQMDPQTAAFLRAAQQSGQYSPQAIGLMQQAAMGQGPSAAQAQLQAGTDQAIKAQMAAAGSRGFNAAAMRGAQMQGAEMQQQAVNQATQLRAQEQQAAQQAFLQASLQQEEMQRQAAIQAAGVNLEQDLGSQQARQAAINAQAATAGQFANFGMQQSLADAQFRQQANLANQDAFLKAAGLNQQAGLESWKAGQQLGLGYQQMGMGSLSDYFNALMSMEGARRNRDFLASDRKWQLAGALIGAGGAVGAAAVGKPRV